MRNCNCATTKTTLSMYCNCGGRRHDFGSFFFFLFFLFLGDEEDEGWESPCRYSAVSRANISCISFSSFVRSSSARWRRKETNVRRAPHRHRGAQAAWAQKRPVSAEGKSVVAPGPVAPAPSGHQAAPLNWLSSVPVGRSSSHAPHHGCDEGLQPVPLRRSAARAEASSAAVAPSSASQRRPLRHQHSSCRQLTSVTGLRRGKETPETNAVQGKRALRAVTLESERRLWWLWFLDDVCVCPHHVPTCKACR